MTGNRIRLMLLASASVLLVGFVGCIPLTSAAAVMKGTWAIIPSEGTNAPVTNWLITFDSSGQVTQVSYTIEGRTTVTWDDPPGFAVVAGDSVHISTTKSGNGLVFEGTLDSATNPTRADGTVSANLNLGGVSISVLQGEASLVRQ